MVFQDVISDLSKSNKVNIWTISRNDGFKTENGVYSYEQAIELAGNGWYNYCLLATVSLSLLSIGLDIFGFPIVVTLSRCQFQLDREMESILVSMPFIGAIIMAYAWGYIADTKGRRKSLLVAMTVSFIISTLSAFSPHWIVLAVCKLLSTCFCSCAQSVSFSLLGESCGKKVSGNYMIIMTSALHFQLSVNYALAYVIGNLSFSVNLGLITFVPWRLLTIVLALPLGICALSLFYFYESPKFLLNAGREEEALEFLKKIYSRNGGDPDQYPVKKLMLLEVGNLERKEVPLLQSIWDQTVPLFKPPRLRNTLLLYYVMFVTFSSSSSLFVWLPFLAESFSAGFDAILSNKTQGLCGMIVNPKSEDSTIENMTCVTGIESPIVIAAVIAGTTYCILNALIARIASRKKLLLIAIYLVAAASGVGAMIIPSNHASVIFYFGILLNNLNVGLASSYFVELYPTSFRGMVSCLGVMVARISSIIGVNTVGPYIRSHCSFTFYGLSVLMLSAVIVSYFLPPDRPKQAALSKENMEDIQNT